MNTVTKLFLAGCGSIIAICGLGLIIFIAWAASLPESGVKTPNEMDQYASDYLAEHNILQADEQLLAYYDVTITMTGAEAAIVTSDRVLYHKNGATTAIALADVDDIRHHEEEFVGDVIQVFPDDGPMMKIEIAPANGGATFLTILEKQWRKHRPDPSQ